MSSLNLEGLEIKEATPSIAPSIYESLQYTKKWRICIALAIGICLIGICVLVFYLSAESKRPKEGDEELRQKGKFASLADDATLRQWRTVADGECLISRNKSCPEEFGDVPVLLLVLGGLRTDQALEIPALNELVKCGASAKSLVPSYPTFDYPNLYSIATGLYPESHGIVSHQMYDEDIGMNFTIGSPSSFTPAWWGGEPIWNTVDKHGMKSATYLWPGSDVQIQGTYPTYWQKDKIDFLTRIRKIVDWIQLPIDERPQLIMMYYEEPLTTSEHFGPFSPKTIAELSKINLGLDELMSSLEREDLLNCINIIVASDHGVAASSCDQSLYVEDMLGESIPGVLYPGTVARIDFGEGTDQSTIDKIAKKLQCQKPALRVLKKSQVPKRYHYTKGSRIGELILDTKSGARVVTGEEHECMEGEFGYNILLRSMQGIFIGHGPNFKVGLRTESFRNIEIYDLLSHLLDVEPAPNNGTRGSLWHTLNEPFDEEAFGEPEVEYLQESIKTFPTRPNKGVLGKYSEVKKNSLSCSCVQEETSIVSSSDISESVPSSVSTTLLTTTTTASTTTTADSSTSKDVPKDVPESSSSTTTLIESSSSTSTSTEPTSSINSTLLSTEASSVFTTTTTTTTESVIDPELAIEVSDEIAYITGEAASESNVTSAEVLGDYVERSSSGEAVSHDELSNITNVPADTSSTGTPSSFAESTTTILYPSSFISVVTSTTTTTAELVPEARHVAEIILSHEDSQYAVSNATDDNVYETHHLAEPLIAMEDQYFTENNDTEDSLYPEYHLEDVIPHESQNDHHNATEISSEFSPTEISTGFADYEEAPTVDHNDDADNNSSILTSAADETGDLLEAEVTTVVESDIIHKQVTFEERTPDFSEASDVNNIAVEQALTITEKVGESNAEEQQSTDPSAAKEENQMEEKTSDITAVENVQSEMPQTEGITQLAQESSNISKPEEGTQLEEETTDTPAIAKEIQVEQENETVTEHETVQTAHGQDIQKNQASESKPLPNEENATEGAEIINDESLSDTQISPIQEEISHIEEPAHTGKEHSPVIDSDTSNVERNHEIEILPIPASLKIMSQVKEAREFEKMDMATLQRFHCPWGFPRYAAPEVASDTLNILLHSSHIIGLPESLNLGVWTSFSISKERLTQLNKAQPPVPDGIYISPEEKKNNLPVGCWISDTRLQRSSSDQCSRTFQTDLYESKNVSLRQLFPEELEIPATLNKEGFLLSNLAPLMKGYESGPRSAMIKAIKKWASHKGPLNVVHGPVFDYDFDGKRDDVTVVRDTIKPIIPSDYFFVVTICNETKSSESSEEIEGVEESEDHEETSSQLEYFNACPLTNLNVYSFVFPNTAESDMCLMTEKDYLQYHLASLADIEELTALKFFRNMNHNAQVQLRARQPLRIPPI